MNTALASLLVLVVSIQKVYIQTLESTPLVTTRQSSEDKNYIQNLEQSHSLRKYIADTKPILLGDHNYEKPLLLPSAQLWNERKDSLSEFSLAHLSITFVKGG
jgi:hypothetical protein